MLLEVVAMKGLKKHIFRIEVFDKDKIGKDTSLGRVEVNLADLKGVKGKWLPLQVNSNFVIS
jgi:hypothetical protein